MPSSTPDGLQLLANRTVALYGLRPTNVIRRDKGYRNHSFAMLLHDGSLVNIIIYKQERGIVDTIRRADAVSDYVAERGIPARHTLDSRIVCAAYSKGQRVARLYDYLPGETIPWEAYTRGHLVSLGLTMAKLHSLLETYHSNDLPNIEDIYMRTAVKMHNYFDDQGVRAALHAKLHLTIEASQFNTYVALLDRCKLLDDRQVLHMDFVRGNILFDGTKIDGIPIISGVLDFEKTAIGHPLFDIARTLAFLLVDTKYKTSEQTTKYFLRSGYSKRGHGTVLSLPVRMNGQKHDLLALLLDFFLLHDFYKFLRHNTYESLHKNEHYKRTVSILLERKIVLPSNQ